MFFYYRWMAPECFGRKAQIIQKSDVWAYGVLVYEIFNKGQMPWPGDKDFKEMAKKIRAGKMPEMPSITPDMLKTLVSKCWIVDYQKRTTFEECYQMLAVYIGARMNEFPLIENLAVNKIPDVHRTFTYREDPPDVRNIQKTPRRTTITATAKDDTTTDGTGKQQTSNSRNSRKNKGHRRKGVSKLTNHE